MKNNELQFLSNVADVLVKDIDTCQLSEDLKLVFAEDKKIKSLNLYVFDNVTNTMRDCVNGWSIIEDSPNIYMAYKEIENHDFIINSKA